MKYNQDINKNVSVSVYLLGVVIAEKLIYASQCMKTFYKCRGKMDYKNIKNYFEGLAVSTALAYALGGCASKSPPQIDVYDAKRNAAIWLGVDISEVVEFGGKLTSRHNSETLETITGLVSGKYQMIKVSNGDYAIVMLPNSPNGLPDKSVRLFVAEQTDFLRKDGILDEREAINYLNVVIENAKKIADSESLK